MAVKMSLNSATKQTQSIDFYKKATFSSLWSSSYHESGRAWGREARE